MALRSKLALWAYVPGSSQAVEYSGQTDTLEFTTLSPGGHGDLSARIRLPDARLPRPELAIFSRIAVMSPTPDPSNCVWIGEIQDPELGMTDTDGEYMLISALGLGNIIRDDPRVVTYNQQTPQTILKSQMNVRSAYLGIDADQTYIFPDNPSVLLSPSYQGRNMEDVVSDLAQTAGDYAWGVDAHPQHRDSAGFPTGLLRVHLRDTTTVGYMASVRARDVVGYRITPSAERAYNVVTLGYYDQSQNPPIGAVQYVDPRLAGDGSQGTAPFRRRNYYRDFSGLSTATKSQLQTVASTYGAEYQNITNKIEITLQRLRDAAGNEIPLWMAQWDRNIFIPELAVRGTPLASTPTPGVNLFYIKSTRYTEDASGTTQLVLECDNFVDTANIQVARLQMIADLQSRTGGTATGLIIALGAPVKGNINEVVNPTGNAQTWSRTVNFPGVLTQAPTSITLTPSSSSNVTSTSASQLGVFGFQFNMVVTSSASPGSWVGTYLTVGNTILAVDEALGTFDHHCDGCGAVQRGLSLARDLLVERFEEAHPGRGHLPGYSALTYHCPLCGAWQGFNTNLGPEDEDETRRHDATHVRRIRQVMRHPHIGLPTREAPLEPAHPPEP